MTIANQPFSQKLSKWLLSSQKKTVGSMLNVFDEKSFAFLFLVLMIFPAVPLPTGGIVHVFEIIVMLLCLQLIIGRDKFWLPQSFSKKELPQSVIKKILPFLMKRILFIERFAKPRGKHIIDKKLFNIQLGFFVFIFTLAAFIAPPFTGLDTLPSLGIVIVALGIILDDLFVIGLGYLVGAIGVGVAFVLGASIIDAVTRFF